MMSPSYTWAFLALLGEQLLTEFVFPWYCVCLFMLENAFIFHM